MNALALLGLLGMGLLADKIGPYEYRIEADGATRGQASISYELKANGELELSQTREVDLNGTEVVVTDVATYNAEGVPVKREMTQEAMGQQAEILFRYKRSEVEATISSGGQEQSQTFTMKGSGSMANPAVFWFVRDIPEPGAKVESVSFDVQSGEFREVTTVYVGVEAIEYDGKQVDAHKITLNGDEVILWTDDQGLPYRVELKESPLGELALIRK